MGKFFQNFDLLAMIALKDLPIQLNDTDIGTFCDRWKILELSLLGSVLREDVRWDCATIYP